MKGFFHNLPLLKCYAFLFSNLELEVEEARNEEERVMIEDATSWLNQKRIDEVLDWQGTIIQTNFLLELGILS